MDETTEWMLRILEADSGRREARLQCRTKEEIDEPGANEERNLPAV